MSDLVTADASADYARKPEVLYRQDGTHPEEFYEFTGLSPAYVSFDGIIFHEVPEGTSMSDFLASFPENQNLDAFRKIFRKRA
jgi:hypothetical protein